MSENSERLDKPLSVVPPGVTEESVFVPENEQEPAHMGTERLSEDVKE